MNKPDVKKLILLNLPYVFAFYFADKIAAVFRLAPGTEFIDKLTNGFAVFGTTFANPLPSFHPVDLLIGLVAGALLKLAVYVKGKNRKKFRQGEEYGSARWGKPEDIKPYMDPEFSNNVILTQTEFLTMNSRPKQPKYARNKNILVIGGSGSGKTRFFVKPNLMQMHSSYVVTDPKGTVLVECGKMLEKGGYVIKSLNTINFRKSMHYNPFSYIRSEKDILKLVNTIIVNTKGDGDKSGEDFWVKAEKLYYTALIGYIWYEAPDHEKNFTTLLEMINASEAREDDETFKNPVDVMFDELEARDPDHFAVKQYRKYKLAAGATSPGRESGRSGCGQTCHRNSSPTSSRSSGWTSRRRSSAGLRTAAESSLTTSWTIWRPLSAPPSTTCSGKNEKTARQRRRAAFFVEKRGKMLKFCRIMLDIIEQMLYNIITGKG